MLTDILKAFLIGICASAPLGPIAMLVVQKTISKGRRAGFLAGMGACVVDTVFAVIAIFALSFAQRFMSENKLLISIIGGIVVIIIGCNMALSNPLKKNKIKTEETSEISIKNFLQALALGLTNPGAILVTFALFAFFHISAVGEDWNILPIILAVSAGSACWWFGITWLLDHFRSRVSLHAILWTNRITGAIVIIIGIALLGDGLFSIIFK